jgi:hypothetical protein
VLQKVNEWRAVRNLAPIPASQLQSSDFNRFDIRMSRSIRIRGPQRRPGRAGVQPLRPR